jgi:hypothetical protein
MGPFEAALQALGALLRHLAVDWPGSKWEWEGRLNCTLSTVAKADEVRAREALTAVLPNVWTSDTLLREAPVPIRQIAARTGGLMARQLLFSVELPDGVFVYGLWWPWGSGASVSVRIGASHESAVPGVRAALGL